MEENVILTDGNSLAKHIHPGGHHFCAYFLVHDFATNEKKRNFYQAIPSHFGHNDHNKGNIVT